MTHLWLENDRFFTETQWEITDFPAGSGSLISIQLFITNNIQIYKIEGFSKILEIILNLVIFSAPESVRLSLI